jgi:hypothetical protein
MDQPNSTSDWSMIEQKLEEESKGILIQTLKELWATFPQVHDFLYTRYLQTPDIPERIKAYEHQIDAQFEEEWSSPDLSQVQQIIQNYQLATGNEEVGTAQLWVSALESAAGFMRGTGLQDINYQNDLIDLAWKCVHFLGRHPHLYPLYVSRLQTVCSWLNETGDEWLAEPLYQLEAEMDGLGEDV